MLKLSIKNPSTQETETYDVATEFNQFFDRAKEYGLINSIFSLKVKDMRAEDAPIRLRADSDIGNGLIRILPDSDSLYDVRVTDESVSGVREELRDDLEANLVNEQYSGTEEMYADIKEMMKSLAGTKISFFCPLTGNLSDHDGDYYETDAYMINSNADAIEEAIAKEQATEINMAEYVGDHAGIKDMVFLLTFSTFCDTINTPPKTKGERNDGKTVWRGVLRGYRSFARTNSRAMASVLGCLPQGGQERKSCPFEPLRALSFASRRRGRNTRLRRERQTVF